MYLCPCHDIIQYLYQNTSKKNKTIKNMRWWGGEGMVKEFLWDFICNFGRADSMTNAEEKRRNKTEFTAVPH